MFLFRTAEHVRRGALKTTFLKKWRALHICLSTGNDLAKLEGEATCLSLGVGFVVAYVPNTSSNVWVQPYDCRSNVFGKLGQWHCLQVPAGRAPVKEVACGRSHLVALTTEGNVYTAGLNPFGQCGTSVTSCHGGQSLSHVTRLAEKISHVSCGLDHTLFLTDSGRVFSCGWSGDGQTGVDSYLNVSSPAQVHLPSDLCFSNVYTCADTAFSQTRNGQLYGWGNNEYGQVGVSSEDDRISKPVLLDLPNLDGQLISMATGGAFTAMLTSSGSVYCMGYSIEDPSLSHDESSGKLLGPQQLREVRKVHDGQTSGHVSSIHAGLHYLVGEVSSKELILWGRYPDSAESEQALPWKQKIKLDSHVLSIAYGPSSIATLSSDNITNPMSFS